MKKNKVLLLIPLLLLAACSSNVPPEPTSSSQHLPPIECDEVYLIMGQSNSDGISPWSFLETKDPDTFAKFNGEGISNIKYCHQIAGGTISSFRNLKFGYGGNETLFGPEIGIGDGLSEPGKTKYIIKAGWSGSVLDTQWFDGNYHRGNLYNSNINFIKERLDELLQSGLNPKVRGVFWMQGESDSSDALCNKYYSNTGYLVNYLREDLSSYIYSHLNFVDAYISTKSPHWKNPTIVNQAKLTVSQNWPDCYCIKTNGEDESALNLDLKAQVGEGDDWAHYSSTSMVALGREAAKYINRW